MNVYRHISRRPLERHVDWLWYDDDLQPGHDCEHVLPDGKFHVKSEYLKNGQCVAVHEVTYQEDSASEVIFE
jgi:hypothetical protein